MKDLHTVPNENLEARITAWVLGEASSFEAAELEVICAADPELQLFLSRTKAIHSLMLETPPSTSDHFWKLSPTKREKLDPIIGPNNSSRAIENSVIPRATYRTIFGIAAVLTITLFIKQFIFSPSKELPLTMASASSESNSEIPATSRMNIDSLNEDLAYQEKNFEFSSSAAKAASPAEEPKGEADNSIAKLDKSNLPPDDAGGYPRSNALSVRSMDLADRKDLDMHQKSASGAARFGKKGKENLSAPPVDSDASALADSLALNDRPLKPKSLYPSDTETTSEKKTSSAIAPVATSMAGELSKSNPQKRSPSTDVTAGLSIEGSEASISPAQAIEVELERDDTGKDAALKKRELLSSHSTVAKFIGIKDHECLGKTSLCPVRCGHSGKLATFEIIEYLDYQKLGEYGDPKQTSFQVLIRDNLGKAKIPAEILSIIESLKTDTKVKLSWNHDYVTRDKTSSPERPITKIEAEQ
ncbi:MAG: hypothetical protein ACK40T_10320 [Akkermansiaceae bacterium]